MKIIYFLTGVAIGAIAGELLLNNKQKEKKLDNIIRIQDEKDKADMQIRELIKQYADKRIAQ